MKKLSVARRLLLLAPFAALMAGCAGHTALARPAPVPEVRPGFLAGYLAADALPNARALLPPPPAAGSAAFALDEEVHRGMVALRDTPRWRVAAEDARLAFPQAAGTFACALNAPVTEVDTPRLYTLLRRTLTDAGLSTYSAKNAYDRGRPFRAANEPICTPDEKAMLAKDGSYPSGHSAVGWAWALVLAEVSPERANAVLARGLAFGESRLVCNVHWHSDVVQGRIVGAAAVARLHADPVFRDDLEAARGELAAARAQGAMPERDCAAEASVLGVATSRPAR
jgi:acid phosphatase (class A)